MPRSSTLLRSAVVENNELAAFWAWPFLIAAFVIFGLIGAGATMLSWCSSSRSR